MPPRLKCLLFDLDNTLMDWSGVYGGWVAIEAPHLQSALAYIQHELPGSADIDCTQLAQHYRALMIRAWEASSQTKRAPHMPSILFAALQACGVPTARLKTEAVMDAFAWSRVPGTTVFPDVPPFLQQARAAGIRLGIVTNASQPMSMRDAELRELGLLSYFPDCRIAAADIGYLKPHPRIFEAALQRLDVQPEETVFIGDDPTADVFGATHAGMRAVLRVNGDYRSPIRPSRHQANIFSFDELPDILDRWFPAWADAS